MSEAIASPPLKETKTQRTERLKLEKNPWEAFNEVREFALSGRGAVLPTWASLYFKWWGIYTQGDGVGVVGGSGGEGKMSEHFMIRIAIPNGILTSAQLRVIARLAKRYGRNLADITVRQAIQLHWLTIESLPEIVDSLAAVGLSPKGACGDVVRNVTGCPLAGLAADEIVDASPLALEIVAALAGNSEFYNLPRKFKISVTGCSDWCSYPEINDIGLAAVKRGLEIGYSVRVGGGLSADPHLAVKLDAFVPPGQAVPVVRTIAEIFRDQKGLRESRDRARLKHLFLREGWTAQSFLSEIESRLHHHFDSAPEEKLPRDLHRDHVGIHAQKQPGLHYVGASILRGRLSGEQLEAAAELAERFGSGDLRTTVMQNLLFVNIASSRSAELARELREIDLPVDGSSFWRGTVACTGTEFCKLAITETKGFGRWLVEEMETRLPQFDQQLKINITGCPNSCGQYWIADIGIEGKKIKHEGKLVDAFQFAVGGAVGEFANLARPLGYRCLSTQVPDAIERLLRGYLNEREADENLRSYLSRNSDEKLRNQLSGAFIKQEENAVVA